MSLIHQRLTSPFPGSQTYRKHPLHLRSTSTDDSKFIQTKNTRSFLAEISKFSIKKPNPHRARAKNSGTIGDSLQNSLDQIAQPKIPKLSASVDNSLDLSRRDSANNKFVTITNFGLQRRMAKSSDSSDMMGCKSESKIGTRKSNRVRRNAVVQTKKNPFWVDLRNSGKSKILDRSKSSRLGNIINETGEASDFRQSFYDNECKFVRTASAFYIKDVESSELEMACSTVKLFPASTQGNFLQKKIQRFSSIQCKAQDTFQKMFTTLKSNYESNIAIINNSELLSQPINNNNQSISLLERTTIDFQKSLETYPTIHLEENIPKLIHFQKFQFCYFHFCAASKTWPMNFISSNSEAEFEFHVGFHKSVYSNESNFVFEYNGNNISVHPPTSGQLPKEIIILVKSPKVPFRTHFSFSFTHPKCQSRIKQDFKPFSRDHLINLFGLDEQLDPPGFTFALADGIRKYKISRSRDSKGIIRNNISECNFLVKVEKRGILGNSNLGTLRKTAKIGI